MTRRALVVGASSLSLGFIIPALTERGVAVSLTNRIATSPNSVRLQQLAARCTVFSNRSNNLEEREIDRFIDSGTRSGRNELTDIVADSDTEIVVLACRKSLGSFLPAIETGLAARTARIFIVSAENTPDEWFLTRRQISASEDLIRYSDSIADRVCKKFPSIDPQLVSHGIDRDIDVAHESYGHWVLESNGESILPTLPVNNEFRHGVNVQYVSTELFPSYRRRKLWLVNGLHLALAINGYNSRFIQLDEFSRSPLGRELSSSISEALVEAVSLVDPQFLAGDLELFSREIIRRFEQEQDTVDRVLGGDNETLTPPSDLELQLKVQHRLSDPADALKAHSPHLAARLQTVVAECPRFS